MRSCIALLGVLVLLTGCSRQDEQKQADWELQSHYQRGSVLLGEGKLAEAEKAFRRVRDLDPDHRGALTKLARVLLQRARRGDDNPARLRAEAVGLLERAVRLEPDNRLAFKELARARLDSGQHQAARRALEKLLELDDSDFASWLQLASIHEKQQQLDEAEKTYQQALKAHPDAGSVRLAYGRFLIRHGRDDQAEQHLRAVSETDPAYYEALDELGGLAARRGKMDEVRRIYARLVEMNPDDYMAWELLAALDEREQKHAAAEKKYRRSLEVDRGHMSGWLGLGRTLRAQGRSREAVYALRKADSFLARNPDKAIELAAELEAMGKRSWALSVLQRASIATTDQDLARAIRERMREIEKAQ